MWGIDVYGEAYVVLDLPNDGAAESIEVAIVLEPPHHLRSRWRPPHGAAARIAHGNGNGKCGLEASVPSFAVNSEQPELNSKIYLRLDLNIDRRA